jgi:DNA-nicking Smr family endonuclease
MDGVLDLHTFRPRDIGGLVPDWLAACQERGLLELRIIHGKGVGTLQRSVHAILSKHPQVERFSLASAHYGGTGATIVHLRHARAASDQAGTRSPSQSKVSGRGQDDGRNQ